MFENLIALQDQSLDFVQIPFDPREPLPAFVQVGYKYRLIPKHLIHCAL
jgi:hypothetical protein